MSTDPLTPNLGLDLVPATRPNWAQKMNDNLVLLDAIVGSYFTVNQLKGIWTNRTVYTVDDSVVDTVSGVVYKALVAHTSATAPVTFAEDRTANPSFWGGYTSPARARGPWMAATSYTVNDFVVSGPQYAICVQNHTSGSTFAADVALGYWSILIDVSAVGTSVLPVPGGAGDSNKFAVTTLNGLGYTIIPVSEVITLLAFSSIGQALFQAGDEATARAAINAQIAGSYVTGGPFQPLGSYQPHATGLDTLSGATLGTYGLTVLAMAGVANLKTSLGGLGTAAPLNVGTAANNVVQMTAATKLPAVDGSLLTNLPSPTGFAPLASPVFTGNPTAPTPTVNDSDFSIATTAFANPGATLAANGKVILPSGLIMQWGKSGSIGIGGTGSIVFPSAFTTLYTINITPNNSAATGGVWGNTNRTTTGFDIVNNCDAAQTFDWFAVGK